MVGVLVAVAAMMAITATQAPFSPSVGYWIGDFTVTAVAAAVGAAVGRLRDQRTAATARVADERALAADERAILTREYRIFQEAPTNSVGDGEATEASVSACRDQRHVVVADNGSGAVEPVTVGHGLTGNRERAALFAGTVDCETHPGDGFTARVRLIPEADPAREAAV